MTVTSVSTLILNLDVENIKFELQLKKHLAPMIVNSIQKVLPRNDMIRIILPNVFSISLQIDVGMIKTKNHFQKCDIAYNSLNNSIYFFMDDVTLTKKITLIGKIISNCTKILDVKDMDKFQLYESSAV
ncbi:MAG: hypothetical protein KAF24_02920 [Nitrosopumilaceae archaeon]|nr:hypothetical protein [Nitrosopumilaceae archaeon]